MNACISNDLKSGRMTHHKILILVNLINTPSKRNSLLINLWYHEFETHYTFYDSISTFWLLIDQDLIQSKVFVLVCLVFFFVLSFSVPFFKVHIMSNTNNITITYTIVHICSYSTTKGKTLTSIKLMVPMTLFL